MINKSILACLALSTAALFVGCSQGAYTPKSDPSSAEAQGFPVVYLDKDLRRVLAADNPVSVGKTEAGFLSVQCGLRNMTNDETLYIQAQTLFRNPAGQVLYTDVGSEPAWQTLTLTPGQTVYYKQSALTAEASNFTVRVRYLARPN
ncbi:MAG: hypothetical protein PHD76_12135 [Methylacidiphilales bacterium]|nr:hypothetical protein [Candidatus Methylacidiphilales bacterium]